MLRWLVALAVAALLLSGCTAMLWEKAAEPKPRVLHTVEVPCTAHDAWRDGDGDLWLRFSAAPVAGAPTHLRPFTAKPGWMRLRPQRPDEHWRRLPGADREAPAEWSLRVTNGNYFARAPNARMWFRGAMHLEELGTWVDADDLAAAVAQRPPLAPSPDPLDQQSRCLDSLQAHDWSALLAAPSTLSRSRVTPLAWLDATNAPVGGDLELALNQPDASGYRLLARLDSPFAEARYIAVAAAVLRCGDDLQLRRDGEEILWAYAPVWRAELRSSAPTDLVRAEAPALATDAFVYRFGREREPSHLPDYLIAAALTPVAVVTDVLVFGNPGLRALYAWLFDDRVRAPRRPGQR
ncbi:MAG: hypothetical protein AAF628_29195 [Planctomycetota bacterium]